jgi:hypothetical protein
MDKINWPLYNSTDFQNFCNALLSFEISKKFIPFSAPGKDGGIDGSYTGTYDGLEGKWRFQYKFYLTARKVAFRTLKNDLKAEIKKIRQEDFLVILTNAEVLPQELEELSEFARKEVKKLGIATQVFIWDGAKVFTLYLQYPILQSWLTSRFSSAQLQDYKVFFKTELQLNDYEPGTLSNEFVARESSFEQLAQFLIDPDRHVTFVNGEPGIGKTRLIIEFFKCCVEPDESWIALTLANYSLNFDQLTYVLNGAKNVVLLIDDAHDLSPQNIAELKNLVKIGRQNSLKLIFTFRAIAFGESTKLVRQHQQADVIAIHLDQLSEAETKALFKKAVAYSYLENYIPQLVEISRGRPILIVALLGAYHEQKHIQMVKSSQVLQNYVHGFFDSFVKKTSDFTGLSQLKVKNILRVICLLEPIEINNKPWLDNFCNLEGLDSDTAGYIFQALTEQHFFSGKSYQEIKPDYYSDIFLMDADTNWLSEKVTSYYSSIDRIIKNLAAVEESLSISGDQSPSLLDKLLDDYLRQLDTGIPYPDFKQIAKTINELNGFKPQYAIRFINKYFTILTDENESLYREVNGVKTTAHFTFYPEYGAVKHILHDLVHREQYYPFVFDTVFKLFELIPDQGLFTETFNYNFIDAVYQFNVKRQLYFVQHSNVMLLGGNHKLSDFIINGYQELLKLSFNSSSWDATGISIQITRYYVPDFSSTNQLRLLILENLSAFYFQTSSQDLKEKTLKLILDIPREIRSASREKLKYGGAAEQQAVIAFLEEAIGDLPVGFHRYVLDRIFYYEEWMIDQDSKNRIFALEEKLAPQTFGGKLIYILTIAETNLKDGYEAIRSVLRQGSRQLLTEYNSEAIAEGINQVWTTSNEKPHHFWEFLEVFYAEYPVKLKEVYELLWTAYRDVADQIGSGFLQALYFTHGENEFYWEKIALLKETASAATYNTILHIYAIKKEAAPIRNEDMDLLLEVFENRFPENSYWCSLALLNIFKLDEAKAVTVMESFLSTCSQRDAGTVFVYLFDLYQDYYASAKYLLLTCTFKFSLEYQFENALKVVIGKDGFPVVFDYLKSRAERRIKAYRLNDYSINYDVFPYGNHSHLLRGVSEAEKSNILMQAVDWYIHQELASDDDYAIEHCRMHLVEYLNSYKSVNEDIDREFRLRMTAEKTNLLYLARLTQCLHIFDQKNELLVNLVIDIYIQASGTKMSSETVFANIKSNCFDAITLMGVKHGTAGQPYPQDVALKQLIEQILEKEHSPEIINFLTGILNYTKSEISRIEGRNQSQW